MRKTDIPYAYAEIKGRLLAFKAYIENCDTYVSREICIRMLNLDELGKSDSDECEE